MKIMNLSINENYISASELLNIASQRRKKTPEELGYSLKCDSPIKCYNSMSGKIICNSRK